MPEPPAAASPWLLARARRDPDALALRDSAGTLTWAALAARVEALAGRLATLGLRPGERVVVLTERARLVVELLHAVQRSGATLVPISARLAPAEIAALVDESDARLVLCDANRAGDPTGIAVGAGAPRILAVEELATVPSAALPSPGRLDPTMPLTILATSGTSARPKRVVLTNGNHAASATASRGHLGPWAGDRWLCVLPLHHAGGLAIVVRSVLDGVAVELHEGFEAARVAAALRAGAITLVSLVPTMLLRLLPHVEGGDPGVPGLRGVLVGGAALPSALEARARAAGLPVLPTYGLTEAASQVATAALDDPARPPASVGLPLPGTRVRIDVPDAGGCGEILVAGPTIMAGYFRRSEATWRALRDGWLHTGDVGRLDRAGYLHVVDRRDDLIVTGGENVAPAEVEAALLAHPDVAEAAVHPRPDPEWGQRVAAAVVLRPGCALDAAALEAWCRARLAGYKVPRAIVALPALPRTPGGKLRRRALAEGGADEPT